MRLLRRSAFITGAAKGIGLAAIQIGVPKRIIVMDISNRDKEKKPMYFVNPIVKNKNSEQL